MLWPENPENDPRKVNVYQRIKVPHPGKKFVFTRTPGGSYTTVGRVYTCGGYPNRGRYSSDDIYCTSAEGGTYDRLSAWEHAEWHYVDGEK